MSFDHTSDEDMLPSNHLDPPEINDLNLPVVEYTDEAPF